MRTYHFMLIKIFVPSHAVFSLSGRQGQEQLSPSRQPLPDVLYLWKAGDIVLSNLFL